MHPLVTALVLLMVCRDAANMTGDRWQRPSRSSRLRGDDLDRRIVNIDPERILREQRAQRRLQSQSQVLHRLVPFPRGNVAKSSNNTGPPNTPIKCCISLPVPVQRICAWVGSGLVQAEDEQGILRFCRQERGRQQQPSSPMAQAQSMTEQQMPPWQASMLQKVALTERLT